MKFNKLVQTILNEYDEHKGMIWYYKWEPYTNENGRQVEYKYQSRYYYENPPSEKDGWFTDPKKAKSFAVEKKGKKQ